MMLFGIAVAILVAVALAVILTITAVMFLLWKWSPGPDLDIFGASRTDSSPPKRYIDGFVTQRTDHERPCSLIVAGTFYRWQDRAHLHDGAEFWRTFLDGPWKWSAQGRFAGSNVNCGHYFSLSEGGASAEVEFYRVEQEQLCLVRARMAVDKILDLTSMAGIRLAFDSVVENSDFSVPFIAEEYIEADRGGTGLTDQIGHWAVQQGYNGILFLGTRAIREPGETRDISPWNYNLFAYSLELYRQTPEKLNLVLFRGTYVCTRISEYTVDDRPSLPNPLFRRSEADIDGSIGQDAAASTFGAAYQEQMRRVFFRDKVKYVNDDPAYDNRPGKAGA